MNKRVLTCLAAFSALAVSADEGIERAIDDVMRFSCLADWGEANSVPEWGCPESLLVEPSFTSLVEVVRTRIDRCDVALACGMTNDVRREVFIAALAQCGTNAYRNAIVMWFGGNVPHSTPAKMADLYVAPAMTRLEGYSIEHYDDPGISNVWTNLKSLFLSEGNVEEAEYIDSVLRGEAKANREIMKKAYNIDTLTP